MMNNSPLSGYTVIYGGSFNPPHIGHAIACMWLVEALSADKVLVVPTYKHAFGKDLVDFDHRINMCKLMCARLPYTEVSALEAHLPHPNITLNTVKEVLKEHNDVAVAIGSDILPEVDEWTGWDEVMQLAKVVVVGRTGSGKIDHDYPIYEYPVDLSAISSSIVRSQIRRQKDVTGLVPSSVKYYIQEHNLYQ